MAMLQMSTEGCQDHLMPVPVVASSMVLTTAQRLTEILPHDSSSSHINIPNDQGRLRAKLATLISDGQSSLEGAKAIIPAVVTGEVIAFGKDAIQTLLGPAKDVVAVLDVFSQIHPAAQVAVGIFKVLVQLEMDRQDNDKNIAALYYMMTDLLFVLSYLDPVFNDPDGLKPMLNKKLEAICGSMNDFGNFCDVYYKHHGVVRFIKSSQYKPKLKSYAMSFSDHKADLLYLVTQKSTVGVTQMKGTLSDVSAKVDKIVDFLFTQSPKEQEVTNVVKQLGGETAVVKNESKLMRIASMMGTEVDTSMRYALHTDLQEILDSNIVLFNLKVESAITQIRDALERSTDTILLRLDSGPHDLIEDPDIRHVWKEMQWRVSCKVRHFVDAVHHHYSHQFGLYQLQTGEVHRHKWTLNFMSKVIFHPAIGDAIDEDASGYVSVYEANRFFRRKPENWDTPEWIAFWAAGWYKNMVAFKYRCLELLDAVESTAKITLPANRKHLQAYVGYDALGEVRMIVESVYTDTLSFHGELSGTGYQALERLRRQYMLSEIQTMKAHLRKPKYQLDCPAAVVAICGTHQVELSIMCLISLLLKRHLNILQIAQKLILSEMEFVAMTCSLYNLLTAFETRFHNLMECWRQQRLDTQLQLSSFAGGMFERWHEELYEESDEDELEDADGSDEDEWHEDIPDEGHSEEPSEMLVYALPMQPRGAHQTVADQAEFTLTPKVKPLSKRQKELQLKAKVAANEAKLNSIERLVQEVLSMTKTIMERQSSN